MIKYAIAERNILTAVQHPFIVSLNSAFQSPERLYLIMDYCPGGDLGMMLAKRGKIPEDIAKIYCAEILLSLEYLHS
jgi:serine/threonine protein kinase